MAFRIEIQDITTLNVDAIVNATNTMLKAAGHGVDYSIHQAAGPELQAACDEIAPCRVGEAKITPAFNLPCKYVIHTVGPVWEDGFSGEKKLLESCYTNALKLAVDNECESIAMPLISAGNHGFPKADVLDIAAKVSRKFLADYEMDIIVCVYTRNLHDDDREGSIAGMSFHRLDRERRRRREENMVCGNAAPQSRPKPVAEALQDIASCYDMVEAASLPAAAAAFDIDEVIAMDLSFGETVAMIVDEKFRKTSEFYTKANISKNTFSKLRIDPAYRPTRQTALAAVVGLGIGLERSDRLLKKAGFALSEYFPGDKPVIQAIKDRRTNVIALNSELFEMDEPQLGSVPRE